MKVPALSNAVHAATIAFLFFAALGSASADVGGGRGRPATPWGKWGNPEPNSAQDIETVKTAADKFVTIWVPGKSLGKTGNELFPLYDVCLRPREAQEGDKVIYALSGKSDSGEDVTLTFSQIESFTATARKDKAIVVSVTVWPDISPKELLEKQPTYTQLKAGYKRTVLLEISTKSADGRPLVFVETDSIDGSNLPLESLTIGEKIDFYGKTDSMINPRRLWWAIPSVTQDDAYPYRVILKK